MLLADVAHDHPHVADRDLGQRHLLDLDEPRVEVPRTGQQHLLLQPAAAAGVDERLAALEALVSGDHGAGHVAGRHRAAVERSHDALPVLPDVVDVQLHGQHAVLGRVRRRDHLEQGRVDPVRSGREDRQLTAALSAAAEERLRVLEAVAPHLAPQHAAGRNRPAVRGDHERDLTRVHHHHRHLGDSIPPPPHREMPSGPEHPGLVARLPVERDDVADRQLAAEALDQEPRLARPDHPEPERDQDHRRREKREHTHPLVEALQPEDPHGRLPPEGASRAPLAEVHVASSLPTLSRAAIEFREFEGESSGIYSCSVRD